MAVLALFGLVLLVVLVALLGMLVGVWSPYWASALWARRMDHRAGRTDLRGRRPVTAEERAAHRELARERLRGWARSINDRF